MASSSSGRYNPLNPPPPSAGREGPMGGAASGGGNNAGAAASSAGGTSAAGGGRRSPLAPPMVARIPPGAAGTVETHHDLSTTITGHTTSPHYSNYGSWYRFGISSGVGSAASSAAAAAARANSPTVMTSTLSSSGMAATMFRFSPRQSWTGYGGAGGGIGGAHGGSGGIIGGGGGSSSASFFGTASSVPSPSITASTALGNNRDAVSQIDPSSSAAAVVVDGVPVDDLRKLASDPDNLSNLFFAQLLYGKTHSPQDALLLARLYLRHGQAGACWRVLEESQLLVPSMNLSWPALVVAVEALASTEDWSTLQQLLLEVITDYVAVSATAAATTSASIGANGMSDGDVEARIIEMLTSTTSASESDRPSDEDRALASRVWYWRGKAHWEVGDPVTATKHWQTSLELDARNQASWNSLLSLHLVTPQQAYEVVMRLHFAKGDGWLRALYLAQIPVTQPLSNDNKSPKARESLMSLPPPLQTSTVDPSLDFGDASSIQLNSPVMATSFYLNDENNAASSKAITTSGHPQRGGRVPTAVASSHALPPCHVKVQEAFTDLTNRYKLGQSPLVVALAARRAYNCYDWKTCLSLCEQLAAEGSIAPTATVPGPSGSHAASSTASADAAYCYVAVLVLLGRHRSLFSLAHEWVSAAPKSPLSWFAVGAYYYSTGRYHVAQRHFCRATRLDPHCSPAWMAFGCSFAVVDESDQALASFRAAQRLAPGDSLPLLYMGIEYVRTNHLTLAQHFLKAARAQSQDDPLCLHESGVLELQKGDLEAAIQWFSRELSVLSKTPTVTASGLNPVAVEAAILDVSDPYWEPTIFNLGHALRKSRQFYLARKCYEQCVALTQSASAHTALAFTTQLAGDTDAAISLYHQALSVKPDDPFASDMLNRALRDSMMHGIDDLLSKTAVPVAAPNSSMRPKGKSGGMKWVGKSTGTTGDDSHYSIDGSTLDQSEDMDSDVDMSG